MKIATVGHCNGIGKAIFDKLRKGHEIIGFDIEDGSCDIQWQRRDYRKV